MKTTESHNAELTGKIEIIPMPPIPDEVLKFLEGTFEMAEKATRGKPQVFLDVHSKE